MASDSLSQAKNVIGRALWNIVEKRLTRKQKHAIWRFFDSQCAYCGVQLMRGDPGSHIDHLESERRPGYNHVSNCVLACGECNGNLKREMDWDKFLESRSGDDKAAYLIRRRKILDWRNECGPAPAREPKIAAEVEESIKRCKEVLARESERLKSLLDSSNR